jgi:hypothetical protein
MKYFMWSAAVLMALTTIAHLFGGTVQIMTPIIETQSLDPAIRSISMVVWHMVTLVLLLTTLAIGYIARTESPALKWFIIASQIGFALIFLFYNIKDFGAIFVMPQWVAFVLCPALMILHRPSTS